MPGDIHSSKKRKRDPGHPKRHEEKRQKNGKGRGKDAPKIIDIPEQSITIQDQDAEFFEGEEIGDFSFLQRLDEKELGKRVEKEKRPREEPPRKKPTLVREESEEEYSDEGDLSEVLSKALSDEEEDVESNGIRDWNEEQAYEEKPRKGGSGWKKKESKLLPLVANGRTLQRPVSESESESDDESEVSDSSSDSDSDEEETIEESVSVKTGPEAVIEAKETLAKLAEEIAESPEEKVSNLKGFREVYNKGNPTIQKLALITQLTVYKDTIPGYRIRPLSETEKTAKVSKEVQQLRNFEESLLSNYKAYIASLIKVIKTSRKDDRLASLSLVAITCVTSLLTNVPHFNFRTDLLKVIVSELSRRTVSEAFTKSREALETLFNEDENGNASLEAVSMLSKMIKSRNYRVHPTVISSLLHLRLLSELGVKASTDSVDKPKLSKKDRVFRTKKERKRLKEQKKVEKDMAEADAQVSTEERERLQSETLKIVFSLYFRTLKETKEDAMLSVVLDGIAKFARLINAEFFGDLLEVLREILEGWDDEDAPHKPRRTRLRDELVCLNTAFTLLANQGESRIDLSFFIDRFYDLLLEISLSPILLVKPSNEERSLIELVVRIVDAILFNPPTAPPPARILLFYKRLLTCALHMEEKEAATFMKLIQRIGRRFEKKIEGMWDTEGAGLGDSKTGRGIRGWELALLGKYYNSNIRQAGGKIWRSDPGTA